MTPSGKIEESVLEEISGNNKSFSNLCLRLAPLIDVIFLLLIFFFISAQFRPAESLLPLDLPAAEAKSSAHIVEPLIIYVFDSEQGCQIQLADKGINISVQNAEQDFTNFVEIFIQILREQKRVLADPVVLAFDNEVKWDYDAKIYNLLYGLGINDITFRLNAEIQ
jgi:biopolymer transport protein ExbD